MHVPVFRRWRRAGRRNKPVGQSLAEFAIILPVFLLILSVAIDLGRMAYARVSIANAAREAAFQASSTPTSYVAGAPCPTPDPATGQVPGNLVICRGILESQGSVVTVAPGDITLTCTPSCTKAYGNTVTVKATGQFKLITPFMAALFGGQTLTFSTSVTNQVAALPATTTTTTTSTTTASTTTTTTTTSTTTTTAACALPSAGFTTAISPSSNNSPVTVTVTDTSLAAAGCAITQWTWNWGDGSPMTFGKVQSPHTYYNTTGAKGNVKTFNLTLTVTNSAGSATSGAAVIQVVK